MSIILFIDGENFKKKIEEVLFIEKVIKEKDDLDWINFDFNGLLNQVLQGTEVNKKIFYCAKIRKHFATSEKSKILIQRNRSLKSHLESETQGFEVVMSGSVRGHSKEEMMQCKKCGFAENKKVMIFKEKGVDVRVAVDMVSMVCDNLLETAILASSDSDLQPAIKELVKRGKKIIYVGFENGPNKGISFVSNRTILIRNSEVVAHYQKVLI